MKKLKRELMLPRLSMEASFEPSSIDHEKRTVEIRWYAGARVQRFSFLDGPFTLAFSMEPKAVRLGRLQSGKAPLKSGHASHDDLSAVVGVLENARLVDGQGIATARFAKTPDVDLIWQKLADGILGSVSMEAAVHELEDVTEKGADQPAFLATDWEPMAVALVAVGADPGAQALAHSERFRCVVTGASGAPTETPMKKVKVRLLADVEDVGKLGEIVEIAEGDFDEDLHSKELEKPEVDDRAEDRFVKDKIEAEGKRRARLAQIATEFELDELWIRRHVKRGTDAKAAWEDAERQAAKHEPDPKGNLTFGEDYNSLGWVCEQTAVALSARSMGKACPEKARVFATASIAECGYAILEKLGHTRGRALDPLRRPLDVVRLALGTSDFPNMLANTLNKNLLERYALAPQTFKQIAQRRDFKDYRAHTFHREGDFPALLQVNEHEEIEHGSMGEGKETVQARRYGRILPISLEVIVNDDLGAFQRFGDQVARRVNDFENATFYSLAITTGSGLGPNLSDGVALYNSAHGNVGSAGALSNTLLGEAFGLMAAQTTIDGLKSNVPPRFLLTSPTSHVLARTLLTAISATQASNINPFAGIMEAIYDANLSGTRFYVLADQAAGSNYIWGTINGQGPRVATKEGWENEGLQVRVSHDFGAGAIDYRFGVTAAGA